VAAPELPVFFQSVFVRRSLASMRVECSSMYGAAFGEVAESGFELEAWNGAEALELCVLRPMAGGSCFTRIPSVMEVGLLCTAAEKVGSLRGKAG
jgi:hypothetical protein